MSSANQYPYTPAELESAFQTLSATLFDVTRDIGEDGNPGPKILTVVGVPGAGKTYMLNNTLLKQPRYKNFVPLYKESFRELHPRYSEFADLDVTARYAHTETFIRELGGKIFEYATSGLYNIILESAMDTPNAAEIIAGPVFAKYQFDVHMIGCKKDFVHMSTIKRALNSLDKGLLERFVEIETIQASIDNAEAILGALELACMRVGGSEIRMYERGFGKLRTTTQLCHSRCDRVNSLTPHEFVDENGVNIPLEIQTHRIERNELMTTPCTVSSFVKLTNAPVVGTEDRKDAWTEATQSLQRLGQYQELAPASITAALQAYIEKYQD
ncbi:zeta toxin family protein [Pseudomonas sp. NPDC090202]|uniref:zeta toxin family protein n=1 Tax=unclassified Pseudomonas TaxID=196821 RepID=UPI00381957FC